MRRAKATRRLRLSPKARATRVLYGRYIGHLRHLKPRQKALVKKIRKSKGVRAAIHAAKRLGRVYPRA